MSSGGHLPKKDKAALAEYAAQVKDLRARLSGQLRSLEGRAEGRAALLAQMHDFVRRRGELASEYARGLQRLADRASQRAPSTRQQRRRQEEEDGETTTSSGRAWRSAGAVPAPCPRSCWALLLAATHGEARCHAAIAEACGGAVAPRLARIADSSARLSKKGRDLGQQLQEELLKFVTEIGATSKAYRLYRAQALAADTKLRDAERRLGGGGASAAGTPARSPSRKLARLLEKRQAKAGEARLREARARNELLLTLAAANSSVERFHDYDLPSIIDCCDVAFHARLSEALSLFVGAGCAADAAQRGALGALRSAVGGLDPRACKRRFLRSSGDLFARPPEFPFRPHLGDEVSELVSQASVRSELRARLQQLRARVAALHAESQQVRASMEETLSALREETPGEGRVAQPWDGRGTTSTSSSTSSTSTTPSTPYSTPSVTTVATATTNNNYHHGNHGNHSHHNHSSPPTRYHGGRHDAENFYFTKLKELLASGHVVSRLQAKQQLIHRALDDGAAGDPSSARTSFAPPKPHRERGRRRPSVIGLRLFGGDLLTYIQESGHVIPTVVVSCVRFINLYGMHQQGIFRVPGSQAEVSEIKHAFERGEDPLLDESGCGDVNSVACVLKLYFRELRTPLLPAAAFSRLLLACSGTEGPLEGAVRIRSVMQELPPPVAVVLRFLFAFLHHLAQLSDENLMDAYNLAVCFGPTLLPAPPAYDEASVTARVHEACRALIALGGAAFPGPRRLPGPLYETCMGLECDGQDAYSEASTVDEEEEVEEVEEVGEAGDGDDGDEEEDAAAAAAMDEERAASDRGSSLPGRHTTTTPGGAAPGWWRREWVPRGPTAGGVVPATLVEMNHGWGGATAPGLGGHPAGSSSGDRDSFGAAGGATVALGLVGPVDGGTATTTAATATATTTAAINSSGNVYPHRTPCLSVPGGGRDGGGGSHRRPLLQRGGAEGDGDEDPFTPEIEAALHNALHELQEMERQGSAERAPDLVLDTFPGSPSPAPPPSSSPSSPPPSSSPPQQHQQQPSPSSLSPPIPAHHHRQRHLCQPCHHHNHRRRDIAPSWSSGVRQPWPSTTHSLPATPVGRRHRLASSSPPPPPGSGLPGSSLRVGLSLGKAAGGPGGARAAGLPPAIRPKPAGLAQASATATAAAIPPAAARVGPPGPTCCPAAAAATAAAAALSSARSMGSIAERHCAL
ncbi:unnamed protein product [Lampetra fluviatilis]